MSSWGSGLAGSQATFVYQPGIGKSNFAGSVATNVQLPPPSIVS
jgi:hypothetical protein